VAGFSITGQLKVSSLQTRFHKEFGLTLRIYDGRSFADPDATLAQVRKKKGSGKALSVAKNMKVGNLEDKIEAEFGLRVQVAGSDDSYLCDNDLTLNQAAQEDENKLARKEKRNDKKNNLIQTKNSFDEKNQELDIENTAKLTFQIKRGIVDLDVIEDEDRSAVDRLIALCSQGKDEEAAKAAMELLSFEFDFDNMDEDPSEFFVFEDIIEIDCDWENSHVRIGMLDGDLLITLETSFEVEVQEGADADAIRDYLVENGGWSAGAYMPLSFAGDDGTNVWLTGLRGVAIDPSG
jgi:hypothetical protein